MIDVRRYKNGTLKPIKERVCEVNGVPCKHNGEICNCSVYAGYPGIEIKYEV